jgi:predicted RNase H-like HicB family nuclease
MVTTGDETISPLCYDNKWRTLSMVREFSVVIERDEDGYFVASVPALRGCHTQAKSLDVLMKRVKEAIQLCLEVEEPVSTEFVGIQRVAVSA